MNLKTLTLDAIETEKNLNKDVELSKEYMEKKKEKDTEVEKMFKVRAFKEELDKSNSELNEMKLREDNLNYSLQYIKERKQNIENQIESISSEIKRYRNQENNIKYNETIKERLMPIFVGVDNLMQHLQLLYTTNDLSAGEQAGQDCVELKEDLDEEMTTRKEAAE